MKKEQFPRMHASFYVSNINQTIEFYSQFFEASPTKQKSNYVKFELASPSLIISFIEDPSKVRSNFGHLGFQVDSLQELNKRFEKVKQQGISFLEENKVSCCYALQDKFWVTDPDGIKWEVYYFHEDVEFLDPFYQSDCCPSPSKEKEKMDKKERACC